MTFPPSRVPPPETFSSRFVRKYLWWLFLLVAPVILSIFWGFHIDATAMLREQMLGQGRAFFTQIVLHREWISDHGGVYVRMRPGVENNPWLLKVPGLKVVIRDESGEAYTLKNPALVTREISELAEKNGVFGFRITSDKPLNPANAPDGFERAALSDFKRGAKEASVYETRAGKTFFRYMAPLAVGKACLLCHAFQGYKEGDVRGGISVTIDATRLIRRIRIHRDYLLLSALAILGVTFGIIGTISRSFLTELRAAEERLVEMATRDSLTGLLTRREMFRLAELEEARARRQERPLSVLMVDIDHFKRVNDTRGHGAGDAVLKAVAQAIRSTLRGYDVVCRYGGEEFLVIMPETPLDQASSAAERLREHVESLKAAVDAGEPVRLTVSIGIALLHQGETVERLIARADAALYAAKDAGRNRACIG